MNNCTSSFCCALFLLLGVLTTSCQSEPGAKLNFVVCLGQSNMAGRGTFLESDTTGTSNPKVLLWNDTGSWEPAVSPYNQYSNIRKDISMQEIGPSEGMGDILASHYDSIGLLVNAKGGSSILEWKKGGDYYDQTLLRVKEAMQKGQLIGMVWHQGESDRKRAAEYNELLAQLIADFRSDVGIPDLPVVVGEIGNWKGNSNEINSVLRAIPDKITITGFVKATDLSHKGDSLHFSREAQLILGTRYAVKLVDIINNKP